MLGRGDIRILRDVKGLFASVRALIVCTVVPPTAISAGILIFTATIRAYHILISVKCHLYRKENLLIAVSSSLFNSRVKSCPAPTYYGVAAAPQLDVCSVVLGER